MRFRKLLLTLHLWLGLLSGTVVLVVAITGCILAFEDEIRSVTERSVIYVQPQTSPPIGVHEAINAVKKYNAKASPTQVRLYGDANKAMQVYTKDKKIYGVNPYTAQVLGVRNQQKDFMFVVLSLHRTLLLGKTGEVIIACNAWIFLVMLLSGLWLWWPGRLKKIRQAITIKRQASAKRRYYDLHSVGGFYLLLPLLFVVVTGIHMTLGNEKVKKTSKLQMQVAATNMYDSLVQAVYHGEPLEVLRVTLPKDSTDVIAIGIRYQTSGLRKQTNFLFDRYNGKLLHQDNWQDKNTKERFFNSDYEVHTGRVWGLPGKIIAFIAALVAASLPITGFLIWRAKNRKR